MLWKWRVSLRQENVIDAALRCLLITPCFLCGDQQMLYPLRREQCLFSVDSRLSSSQRQTDVDREMVDLV